MMKAQILESLGFGPTEQFPVYSDKFPNQMLAYLRLSRIADPALFAKVIEGQQSKDTQTGRAFFRGGGGGQSLSCARQVVPCTGRPWIGAADGGVFDGV